MKKKLKLLLIAVVAVVAVGAGGFLVYTADYYHADDVAVTVMTGDRGIETSGNLTILSPSYPSEVGFIFYPGGKVEHTAYLPLLQLLQRQGITCVLVEMPFRLAVLSQNRADAVFDQLPEIDTWYIGGHSLGGAMASGYAAQHPEKIEGVVLLGAYLYGDVAPENALTIYGSEDLVLNRDKIAYEENVVVLPGGNHAQFGNYGIQRGDGEATISREAQQQQAVQAMLDFVGQ